MPIRTASMKNRIAANGQALHRAKERAAPEAEAALTEERAQLKKEREERRAKALEPRPSALDKLVRTHHPEKKAGSGKKEKPRAEGTKKPKAVRSRAEKHAEQAAAVEAARNRPKKTAAK